MVTPVLVGSRACAWQLLSLPSAGGSAWSRWVRAPDSGATSKLDGSLNGPRRMRAAVIGSDFHALLPTDATAHRPVTVVHAGFEAQLPSEPTPELPPFDTAFWSAGPVRASTDDAIHRVTRGRGERAAAPHLRSAASHESGALGDPCQRRLQIRFVSESANHPRPAGRSA
jgi:hypothetical protein